MIMRLKALATHQWKTYSGVIKNNVVSHQSNVKVLQLASSIRENMMSLSKEMSI